MTDEPRAATLKCIIAASWRGSFQEIAAAADGAHIDIGDRRMLSREAMLVYTTATPAEIRDALTPLLDAGSSLFVVEFERWSSYGAEVDTEWLLRRGH